MQENKQLAKAIAGDIVFSPEDGIRGWRIIFGVQQRELAIAMGSTPSLISEYETGRKQPRADTVKRIVSAFLAIDRDMETNVAENFRLIYLNRGDGICRKN